MNAPILADKQGTPARPTRGLLDTTLDSQNKDRRLAIVGAWLAFMIGLAADGTVDSPASFGVAGTVGAVIVALGFAAASRCRLLPQRSHKHRVRLVFLSIAVGGAVGLINLAANWAITEADPALRALLVERIMAKEPWEVLVTGPMTEEVVFRLFVMSGMAWLVYRNAKRERLAFAIVLVGSAVIFAVPHLERPLPDARGLLSRGADGQIHLAWCAARLGLLALGAPARDHLSQWCECRAHGPPMACLLTTLLMGTESPTRRRQLCRLLFA